jgi:lysine biosynthesis protein LysW
VLCPDCGSKITLGSRVELGLTFICPRCDAELEVVSTRPLEVDWVYDEFWDEEEYEPLAQPVQEARR